MNDIEQKVMEAALRKMFAGGHFSICTIDKCLEILGIPRGGKTYGLLSALHCVDFAQMDKALAAQVPSMIGEVLNGLPFDVADVMGKRVESRAQIVDITPAKRSGILKLLGL